MRLSVIVPIGDGDRAWQSLMPFLKSLSFDDEIIFSVNSEAQSEILELVTNCKLTVPVKFANSNSGRAAQLNAGAAIALNDIFWFLHCDSQFSNEVVKNLRVVLKQDPAKIYCFNLRFLTDGPKLMSLNTWGVWIRTHWLKLPFGDQGLCMRRDTFEALGGFDIHAKYGEDHLFIWKAHQTGIKIYCLDESIFTSARKYKNRGWASTTVNHLHLTLKQAVPAAVRLLREKF